MVLSDSDIRKFCAVDPPLVDGCPDREQQIQPGGIDLTLARVFELISHGVINRKPGTNVKAAREEVNSDANDMFHLSSGYYVIACNEIISMPTNLVGFAHPRSTLLRYGSFLVTGVWDPGFRGHSQLGLVVANSAGIRIERNAVIAQMTFHSLTADTAGFQHNHLYEKGLIV